MTIIYNPDDKKRTLGGEEQLYCPQHDDMKAMMRRSVPRWAFLTAMSAALSIALIFGGWVQIRLDDIENHLREQIQTVNNLYVRDVERFYRAAEQNGVKLEALKTNIYALDKKMAETVRVQNLVLKKINLAGNNPTEKQE